MLGSLEHSETDTGVALGHWNDDRGQGFHHDRIRTPIQ